MEGRQKEGGKKWKGGIDGSREGRNGKGVIENNRRKVKGRGCQGEPLSRPLEVCSLVTLVCLELLGVPCMTLPGCYTHRCSLLSVLLLLLLQLRLSDRG